MFHLTEKLILTVLSALVILIMTMIFCSNDEDLFYIVSKNLVMFVVAILLILLTIFWAI